MTLYSIGLWGNRDLSVNGEWATLNEGKVLIGFLDVLFISDCRDILDKEGFYTGRK